jgi:pimeloyl-ACP methyl ester carboxylesterase
MMATETLEKLDAREVHFRIPGPIKGLQIFLRYLPPARSAGRPKVVLFIHGMSFPSALSIAHRFDGRSWRDELCNAGFDVWGVDFYGFGYSDRYSEMSQPPESNPPFGQAEEISQQIDCAVRFICDQHAAPKLSVIAHSGGTIGTALFAIRNPDMVDRLVFFAPIAQREPAQREPKDEPAPRFPAWRLISLKDQWQRFTEDVPSGQPPVLSEEPFRDWGERYLSTDVDSSTRSPASVKTPTGMIHDIISAWQGRLSYDPSRVSAPVAIIRGEWDRMCTDVDARWLFDALSNSPVKRDVKISRATHLMHLEKHRYALYREAQTFLEGEIIHDQIDIRS